MQLHDIRAWVYPLHAVLAVTFSAAVTAQAPTVTYHDLSSMSTWPLGNMQVKGTAGQLGSFAIAEMPPGKSGQAGNPHHHTQEQIVVGLNGSPVLALSGRVYRLGTYGAVIAPPNSEHVNMNGSLADRSTFIEFQPVVRRDWFPPYPSFASAASPSPIAVSRDMRVFENFDPSSDGWTVQADGARSKSLSGQTVQLTVWDLSSPTASATVNPAGTRSEQFVYVFDGAAQIAGMSEGRVMAAQTLAVISQSAQALQLRSVGKVRTTVGVFEVK